MGSIEPYSTASGTRYRVRYRTPDRRQTDKRGFQSKKDAQLFLASVEIAKARGEFVAAAESKVSVGLLGEQWLKTKRRLKPSSYLVLEGAWNTYVAPRWSETRIADIRHSDVDAWVSELSSGTAATRINPNRRYPANERRPLSASTVLRAYGVLAAILDTAVKDQRITRNPARGLQSLPKKERTRHLYLSHEQVHRLADASGELSSLVLVLAYCGLRWGELSALRVRDLDLDRRRLEVRENAVLAGGALHVGSPKNHEQRSVPLPRFLVDVLSTRTTGRAPDELVFPDRNGGYRLVPNSSKGKKSWWLTALRHAGLDRMGVHDLRHTTASLMVSSGANVKAVQRALGHKSAAMTLDVYAELFEDDLDDVADSLDHAVRALDVGKAWARVRDDGAENDESP